MVDETVPDNVEAQIDETTGTKRVRGSSGKQEPSYRVFAEAKLPVSKHYGPIWKTRKETGETARDKYKDAWDEAIRYYNGDQLKHRDVGREEEAGNQTYSRHLGGKWSETENIVFSNITTLLPGLYAKNPKTEVTDDKGNEERARMWERLVNALFAGKAHPSVNMKPKARKAVLKALLTNCAWGEVGWTKREGSNEQTMEEIEKLSEELAKAKSQRKIFEIEGQIMALEKHLDILLPEGPFVRVRDAYDVVIDPEGEEADLTDHRWILIADMLPTEYLNARYTTGGEDKKSVYKPTHLLRGTNEGTDTTEEDVNNFVLFPKEGEDNDERDKSRDRTKVWFCWDRTTRRVFMYHDEDWTWPIWVWDDPYKLTNFFPVCPLAFHDNPISWYAKGEVTYYLDQQDAINDINSEQATARTWARKNIIYDTNSGVTKEQVEGLLHGGGDENAVGIDLPEGMKIGDIVGTVPVPSLNFPQLFDKSDKYQAIDRISSVRDVERGAQFRTNTTNDAIEEYTRTGAVRSDEKVDLIEDWLSAVGRGLLELCLQFMTPEQVAALIGAEQAAGWESMDSETIRTEVNIRIIGGSTAKPTSQAKKKEALEAGQILGQFANATPIVVEIMLRMFEQAFDEVVIKAEDWKLVRETMFASLDKAGQGPGGPAANGTGQIPPEAQQAIQLAVQRGVPPEQAQQAVLSQLSQ